MAIRNNYCNTCFYLHDRFSIRKLFLVRHGTLRILSWWVEPIHIWIWMPNIKNFTAKSNDDLLRLIQIRISPKRGKCTWNYWMGPICNPNWRTSGMRVTLSYLSTNGNGNAIILIILAIISNRHGAPPKIRKAYVIQR
jgi:hypothetical protein